MLKSQKSLKIGARIAFGAVILLELAAPLFFRNMATDFTWLGLIVTAAFAWSVLELLKLSPWLFWLGLGAIILDGTSAVLELYSRIQPWDLWVHALGGALIAICALELILRALKNEHISVRHQKPFIAGAIYLFTATIGFLYEFWEYLVDRFQYGYPKSLVSAYDSVEDQLLNLVGATLVLVGYFLWRRNKRRGS